MDGIKSGMAVRSLEDRSLGEVTNVHGCCFQFDLRSGGGHMSVVMGGVFHIHMSVVTLICTEQEVRRYSCQSHPQVVSKPTGSMRSGQVFGRPTRVLAEQPEAMSQQT